MPLTTLFSLPVPFHQQPTIKNSTQYSRGKRKRGIQNEGQPDVAGGIIDRLDIQEGTEQDERRSTFLEYSAVLTPDERHQYRISGQTFGQPPPTLPFPHAPQTHVLSSRTRAGIQKCLADLDPPVYPMKSHTTGTTLHQQHLAVLTAVLHRCLMEKDFLRAGRALSLLLHDEIGGQPIDMRSEDRWGIGAEILLRGDAQSERTGRVPRPSSSTSDEVIVDESQSLPPLFTRMGFEDAKKYYERLIIQYPFHKTHPTAVSALNFYPAMFGLWIYVVHEESYLYLGSNRDSSNGPSLDNGPLSPQSHESQRGTARRRELEQARDIAARMDSCMEKLPFADDPQLMKLRGMVALWIADLCDLIAEQSEDDMDLDRNVVDDLTADIARVSLVAATRSTPLLALRSEATGCRATGEKWFSKLRVRN